MKAFKTEGDSGQTFYLSVDGTLWLQVEHPNGKLGQAQESSWPIEKVKGAFGAEDIPVSELPESLKAMAP